MDKVKVLLASSRPVSWINTAYPFAAGYLVMAGQIDMRLIVGTLFFLIPYNLIVYGINDVFDYESDIRNPRKGGIEGAVTAKKYHKLIIWTSALLALPFVVFLMLSGTVLSALTLVAVLFFAFAYSVKGLRFKEVPFLDSITSSIHFVGPLVYALSLTSFQAEALAAVLAFFFWGMASHAFGAVQDIVPDREGGIKSIATALGASRTVWFSLILYALSGLALLAYGWPVALYGLVGLVYVLNIAPYLHVSDEESHASNKAWRRFIYLNQFAGFAATILLIYLFALSS